MIQRSAIPVWARRTRLKASSWFAVSIGSVLCVVLLSTSFDIGRDRLVSFSEEVPADFAFVLRGAHRAFADEEDAEVYLGGRRLEEEKGECLEVASGGGNYPPDYLLGDEYEIGTYKNAPTGRKFLVVVHCIGIMYMLIGLNLVCDVYFAGSLEGMVDEFQVKPDVAGATFMAAGGSAPELFTSLLGACVSQSDVGFSTIVGSAVFNVLFVIGLCGWVATKDIELTWWPLFRDCSYYIFGLSVLALFASDTEIKWFEALILFLMYVNYCVMMYFNDRMEEFFARSKNSRVAPEVSKEAPLPNQPPQKLAEADPEMTPEATPEPVPEVESISEVTAKPIADVSNGAASSSCGALRAAANGSADDKGNAHCNEAELTEAELVRAIFDLCDVSKSRAVKLTDLRQIITKDPMVSKLFFEPLDDEEISSEKKEAMMEIIFEGVPDGSEENDSEKRLTLPEFEKWVEEKKEDLENFLDEDEHFMTRPDGSDKCALLLWYFCLPVYTICYWGIPSPMYFRAAFCVSLMFIAGFSFFLVWWVEILCDIFHVGTNVAGFTVLAAGTSIPDAVSSMAVARQDEGDMAVSSSIGSNIFDILVGLPIPWMIKIGFVEGVGRGNSGFTVKIFSPYLAVLVILLLLMVFMVIVCIHLCKWRLSKKLGLCMAFLYFIFLCVALFVEEVKPCFLMLNPTENDKNCCT